MSKYQRGVAGSAPGVGECFPPDRALQRMRGNLSALKQITLVPPPVVDFSFVQNPEAPSGITFTQLINGLWTQASYSVFSGPGIPNPGDSTIEPGDSPLAMVFATLGTYSIELTVESPSGTFSIVKTNLFTVTSPE